MKTLLLILLFLISIKIVHSQNTYVRMYNYDGKLIAAGRIDSVMESKMILSGNDRFNEIPISEIKYLKKRHPAGPAVLICTAIGALTGLVLASNADYGDDLIYNKSDAQIAGAGLGFITGLFIGTVIFLPHSNDRIMINGDPQKLKTWLDRKNPTEKFNYNDPYEMSRRKKYEQY